MSIETFQKRESELLFEVTNEQREELSAEDQICLILATDGVMMQFNKDPSKINDRLMDLTGLDREHLVTANRTLVGDSGQRAKLMQFERDEDTKGVRLALTEIGKQHLENRIKEFTSPVE